MSNIATSKKEQFLFDFGDIEEKPPTPVEATNLEAITSVRYIEADLSNIQEMLPKLYDHQQEDVLRIEKRFQVGKGYLCTNGTGTGKAQPLTSMIMTPNGYKPMGLIKAGDKVIGSEGKAIDVTAVYPQGLKEIYEIKFSDGSKTECCEEHLWETQTQYERRKSSINKNWNCAKPKIRSLKEISDTVDKQHFIPIADPIELNYKNDLVIPPYVMGSLLGDGGFTTGTIVFTSNDKESVELISTMLPNYLEIRLIEKSNKSPQYRIALKKEAPRKDDGTFGSNPWIKHLKQLGLYGLKSDKKFVPEKYLFGSIKQRTELLQGLLDTDGWVDKKSKSPYFCSVSKQLADSVAFLARSLGGTAKISEKFPTYHYKGENHEGLKAYNVLLNMPANILPFALTRKLDLYKPNTKYPPRRKITSVEFMGIKEAQCIAVDHPRHLYVTDDCVLTHNTFVGLGAIKRFLLKGKNNILIVTPTETKCLDWIDEAKHVDLKIYMLQGITDKGHNIRVTTYANFYQNEALDEIPWDLIVYDESHYLNQNSKGQATSYLDKHRVVSNLPSAVKNKAHDIIGLMPKYNPAKDDYELYHWQLDAWRNQMRTYTYETVSKTKVLFLSATPFAYHKSIMYADGSLFEINETLEEKEQGRGYNEPKGFDKFLIDHFGYRMKYNKCTIPETGVDQSLMERMFFENHVEKGVMSTKILELEQDYSRDFFLVDSDLGNFINSGIEMWFDKYVYEKYPLMSNVISKKYNYLYVNQLLEAIKSKEVNSRIQEHLDLGRKVVIFHSYNHNTVEHPFRFDESKLTTKDEEWFKGDLKDEIHKWYSEYPQYANLSLKELDNCRATIRKVFPDALEFNGTISKKKKKINIESFNDDNSGSDIIIVQSKAGREGISLHDKYGGKPRVLINLSLPVAPTEAIQTEGRIYRSGLQSNSMFEYPVIHTNFEKIAFATKIAERAKTAENLAMGNLARDLETAFKEGYMNATMEAPSLSQGIGGKESDRALLEISEYDKAKTFYFARGKKNAKNKALEGKDYFATPEPLGFKMLEWLDPQPDEKGLEPSAGHGAIGRWFPGFCSNIFVEPSLELYSEMTINCNGRHENVTFEEFKLVNKADFIAMNPPFGNNSRQAAEHIQKALLHMFQRSKKGARLLAIVPAGASMIRNLDRLMEHKLFNNFRLTGEMLLPEVTFKRAGTGVMCKILRIEHVNTGNENFNQVDLTYCKDIEEFFDEIEHLNF